LDDRDAHKILMRAIVAEHEHSVGESPRYASNENEHTAKLKRILEDERKPWVKSKLPTEVQLRAPFTGEILKRSIWGLLREEYDLPVLCIETHLEHFDPLSKEKQDFETARKRSELTQDLSSDSEFVLITPAKPSVKTQMVPMQFVAGGASIWVNLGDKKLWEKLSGAPLWCAFILVDIEITYSLLSHGHMITTCDDIRNSPCLFWDNKAQGRPIFFKYSLGLWVAFGGCIASFLACICLRVANKLDMDCIQEAGDDAETSDGMCARFPRKLSWQCSRYAEAIWFHVIITLKLFTVWPCRYGLASCCSRAAACCSRVDQGLVTGHDQELFDIIPKDLTSKNAGLPDSF